MILWRNKKNIFLIFPLIWVYQQTAKVLIRLQMCRLTTDFNVCGCLENRLSGCCSFSNLAAAQFLRIRRSFPKNQTFCCSFPKNQAGYCSVPKNQTAAAHFLRRRRAAAQFLRIRLVAAQFLRIRLSAAYFLRIRLNAAHFLRIRLAAAHSLRIRLMLSPEK